MREYLLPLLHLDEVEAFKACAEKHVSAMDLDSYLQNGISSQCFPLQAAQENANSLFGSQGSRPMVFSARVVTMATIWEIRLAKLLQTVSIICAAYHSERRRICKGICPQLDAQIALHWQQRYSVG